MVIRKKNLENTLCRTDKDKLNVILKKSYPTGYS